VEGAHNNQRERENVAESLNLVGIETFLERDHKENNPDGK
jgi:hypothetical protein